jgi:hypothetical protein
VEIKWRKGKYGELREEERGRAEEVFFRTRNIMCLFRE